MKKIIYASFIAVLLFNTGCGKKKSGPWAPDAINDTSQELIEKNIEEISIILDMSIIDTMNIISIMEIENIIEKKDDGNYRLKTKE